MSLVPHDTSELQTLAVLSFFFQNLWPGDVCLVVAVVSVAVVCLLLLLLH